MRSTNVVIEQPDIAASDLKRRRTVAEDPLEGEDVAAVRKESPREAVPQDVRGASVCDPRRAGESPDELLNGSSGQGDAPTSNEQWRGCVDPAARGQPGPQRPSATAADGHQPLARSLPANPAAPLDKIKVTDADPDQLAQADAGVKEKRDDGLIAERLL
jgi:hypothetical protein